MKDNELIKNENNIIDLSTARFPVNSKAWHSVHRLCSIVESKGNKRVIRVLKLGVVDLQFQTLTVHVNELSSLETIAD
jgi:hypothetical protein